MLNLQTGILPVKRHHKDLRLSLNVAVLITTGYSRSTHILPTLFTVTDLFFSSLPKVVIEFAVYTFLHENCDYQIIIAIVDPCVATPISLIGLP